VIVNSNLIFGGPPNVDADDLTDILLYDIGGGRGGYVHPADYVPTTEPGVGNFADVLYVDPLFGTTNTANIATHEYIHLLHAKTNWDESFLAEGYAEYGTVLNGFGFLRSISYPFFQFEVQIDEETVKNVWEYELPLFTWRNLNGLDYQRGNHFFTYVSEQFRPETVGLMLQQPSTKKGAVGLQEILEAEGGDLGDLVLAFHAANFINDVGQDPQYGHLEPGRTNLRINPTRVIDGEQQVVNDEDELGYETNVPSKEISAGAVEYVQWENVADYSIVYDATGFEGVCANPALQTICESSRSSKRERIRAVVIGIRPDDSIVIQEITASDEAQLFAGRFKSLTLIAAHTDPGAFNPASPSPPPMFRYTAEWTPLSLVTGSDDVAELPAASLISQNFPNPFSGGTTIPFELTKSGHVKLGVYDVLGREKVILLDDLRTAGSHSIELNANGWASGPYLIRLESEGQVSTRIIQLVK
jgi:hypothetical protein